MNPRCRKHLIEPKYKKAGKDIPPVTILSSNCIGGVLGHELGWQFLSPTVNLWMWLKDFIKYCSRLRHYSQCELRLVNPTLL